MKPPTSQRVVLVGASDKSDRYAHQAQMLLQLHGHEVVPVHPKLAEIAGVPVVADLSGIQGAVDTVTLYVGPAISAGLADKLVSLKPRRVIFNPGTENAELAAKLQAVGICAEQACTLVLLQSGQF